MCNRSDFTFLYPPVLSFLLLPATPSSEMPLGNMGGGFTQATDPLLVYLVWIICAGANIIEGVVAAPSP